MEASSPLAAMQPPSLMAWNRKDLYDTRFGNSNAYSPGAFNFNNMNMGKTVSQEYFSLNPIHGSSPTTSLAADLSQNFHIDMSPVLPTPRRSLFTTNLFGKLDYKGTDFGTDIDSTMDSANEHPETATTPPIATSPGDYESMDISPLPHKAPFSLQIEVHSPCPTPSSETSESVDSSSLKEKLLEVPRVQERKRPNLLRPSVNRHKAYSSTSIPQRDKSQPPLQPFKFGATKSNLSSAMSLEDAFASSPPPAKRLSLDNETYSFMAPPPKLKQSFSDSVRNASPIGHTRRSSNPLVRPRKQFRRACSMFETKDDVLMEKVHSPTSTSSALHSIMDIDEVHKPVLPHFYPDGDEDSIPRITRDTLIQVLNGTYDSSYDSKKVIDCRFEYEFNGGHIDGAFNYNDKDILAEELLEQASRNKTLLVFHCEYSAHRAPLMARHVRQQDRAHNIEHYPRLHYPEVYILEGGYSGFFKEFREKCYPQNYVEMDDKNHAHTCEREMGRINRKGARTKLGRAQTFAFGQHSDGVEDSPTAPSRSARNQDTRMLIDSSPLTRDDRQPNRRMASY